MSRRETFVRGKKEVSFAAGRRGGNGDVQLGWREVGSGSILPVCTDQSEESQGEKVSRRAAHSSL